MSVVKNERIFVKTFDGFDVYVNGKLIYFPAARQSEMLAVFGGKAWKQRILIPDDVFTV